MLRIAVVGHTNAGKTSLLRTLTRRIDFGEVSDLPGTTRHVESIDLRVDGRTAVRFFDTPGLEDAVALVAHLRALDGDDGRLARVRRFLEGPEAHGIFEQEAKVLRSMLDVDAAFLVIDAREPPLPKFRDEIELLNSCARPVLPVLNFVRSAGERESAWREMLSDQGLHALVRFDAAAPFTGAERHLYQDLATLLPAQRTSLQRITDFLEREFDARRQAGCSVIADLLVNVASMRHVGEAQELDDPERRRAHAEGLRRDVFASAQRAIDELLALYGFREGDADEAPLPQVQGRWAFDLFDPETLRDVGVRLSAGMAIGAAVGVVADLALAGLSLGAGAALGSAIGGALSQGWGPVGRRIGHWISGQQELAVEDSVLVVLAQWQLELLQALEQRGHAATGRIGTTSPPAAPGLDSAQLPGDDAADPVPPAVEDLVAQRGWRDLAAALNPARTHPAWAERRHRDDHDRQRLVAAVADELGALLPART